MKATWTVSRNQNGVMIVEVCCARCGRKQGSPSLELFFHGGPCGVRTEFPSEKIREHYAELKEAKRQFRCPPVPHPNFRKILYHSREK